MNSLFGLVTCVKGLVWSAIIGISINNYDVTRQLVCFMKLLWLHFGGFNTILWELYSNVCIFINGAGILVVNGLWSNLCCCSVVIIEWQPTSPHIHCKGGGIERRVSFRQSLFLIASTKGVLVLLFVIVHTHINISFK